jgi:hypothetical protein
LLKQTPNKCLTGADRATDDARSRQIEALLSQFKPANPDVKTNIIKRSTERLTWEEFKAEKKKVFTD